MEVFSANIGTTTSFVWNGEEEQTGIFKYPVNEPLYLRKVDVAKDTIINRVNHGGINKACYIFSKEEYPYWKGVYPDLSWDWGMFGENLTVEGWDDSKIRIGDIFRVGNAMVQVSQPREPCYKLGVRFGSQKILKQYIQRGYPGSYVRILKEGHVGRGDIFHLVEQSKNELTVKQFFDLVLKKEKKSELLQLFMSNDSVPEYKKERMKKYS